MMLPQTAAAVREVFDAGLCPDCGARPAPPPPTWLDEIPLTAWGICVCGRRLIWRDLCPPEGQPGIEGLMLAEARDYHLRIWEAGGRSTLLHREHHTAIVHYQTLSDPGAVYHRPFRWDGPFAARWAATFPGARVEHRAGPEPIVVPLAETRTAADGTVADTYPVAWAAPYVHVQRMTDAEAFRYCFRRERLGTMEDGKTETWHWVLK